MSFVAAFLLYALMHSLLASHRVKNAVFRKFPGFRYHYRLFYNIIALLGFAAIWFFVPVRDITIYSIPSPWNFLFHAVQLAAVAGALITALRFGGGTFSGLSQLRHGLRHDPPRYFLDEPLGAELIIGGPYRYVRHPLYFFSLMFLVFHPYMTLKWLLLTVCCGLYFLVGSMPEEQKLVERFGDAYEDYRKQVPGLIPMPGRRYKGEGP